MKSCFAVLVILAAAQDVVAPQRAPIEVVEYGEYQPGPEIGKQRADTALGYVDVVEGTHDPVLIARTDVVHAGIGTWFGIKILVPGEPGDDDTVSLRIRVLHPPFRSPGSGELSEREEWEAEVDIGIPRFNGWSFDEPWELAPGRWTIQVLDGDEVVAEQAFEVVVRASAAPGRGRSPSLDRLPKELWERAAVILTGTYTEGRTPCIWVNEDERRWYLTRGFTITGTHRGKIRSPYVEVDLSTPAERPYVCEQCMVPGRHYLLLLRPSPHSMQFLDTDREALRWPNRLGSEEVLAIVEVPADYRLPPEKR